MHIENRAIISQILAFCDIKGILSFHTAANTILRTVICSSITSLHSGKIGFSESCCSIFDFCAVNTTDRIFIESVSSAVAPNLIILSLDLSQYSYNKPLEDFPFENFQSLCASLGSFEYPALHTLQLRIAGNGQQCKCETTISLLRELIWHKRLGYLKELSFDIASLVKSNTNFHFIEDVRAFCPLVEKLDVFSVLSAMDCKLFIENPAGWPLLRSLNVCALVERMDNLFHSYDDVSFDILIEYFQSTQDNEFIGEIASLWAEVLVNLTRAKFPALIEMEFFFQTEPDVFIFFETALALVASGQRIDSATFVGAQIRVLKLSTVYLDEDEHDFHFKLKWASLARSVANRAAMASAQLEADWRFGTEESEAAGMGSRVTRGLEQGVGPAFFSSSSHLSNMILFPKVRSVLCNQKLFSPQFMLLLGSGRGLPQEAGIHDASSCPQQQGQPTGKADPYPLQQFEEGLALELRAPNGDDDGELRDFLRDWYSPQRWHITSLKISSRKYMPPDSCTRAFYSDAVHGLFQSTYVLDSTVIDKSNKIAQQELSCVSTPTVATTAVPGGATIAVSSGTEGVTLRQHPDILQDEQQTQLQPSQQQHGATSSEVNDGAPQLEQLHPEGAVAVGGVGVGGVGVGVGGVGVGGGRLGRIIRAAGGLQEAVQLQQEARTLPFFEEFDRRYGTIYDGTDDDSVSVSDTEHEDGTTAAAASAAAREGFGSGQYRHLHNHPSRAKLQLCTPAHEVALFHCIRQRKLSNLRFLGCITQFLQPLLL